MYLLVVVICALTLEFSEAVFIHRGPIRYNVEMDVFSGRSSPSWTVTTDNPYYDVINFGLAHIRPTRLSEELGYRGFGIEMRNALGQRAYKTIGAGSYPRMELFLLNSAPFRIEPAVRRHIIDHLTRRRPRLFQTSVRSKAIEDQPLPKCRLPRYDPDRWNTQPTIQLNNCYNYASQRQTNTFAQPGRASGRQFRRPATVSEVMGATIRDGFIPLPFYHPETFSGTCMMALAIWPGVDYHFYRLDDNLLWSHKPGKTPARNVDNGGNRIIDPRTADRGNYITFAGYLGNHQGARVV